ncbi:PREDICTED: olfactory receptor 51E1-like [Dipodomys ordii]|uniref:Olfactory receptor n=1 Tax=Dipodomys ordii TaxID=10020 RepID=A0A1S3GQR1_DIPOR|nr:PREDICTED: olfactory receptor 51E1-like [Dipodomys ordii]
MKSFRTNISSTTSFTLTGFPEMENLEHWLAALLLLLYAISILGNTLILFIIKEEQSLHQPMYYFLSLLSVNDLGVSLSTLPTVLASVCFHATEIAFDACLAQMFFIHFFSWMESGILLAMSFDRYVAICSPLRYSSVLTDARVAHMGISIIVRSFCMVFPLSFLLKRLPFCKANVLTHSYCLHPDLIRLPCGDTTINSMYGLFIVISAFGVDSLLVYLFVPPMLNPIIYSIKTKEIRRRIHKLLFRPKF